MSTWRDSISQRVADVVRDIGLDDIQALRKALREAYPYGERRYHPYKVWLSEVHRQTGGRLRRKKPDSDLFAHA